MYTDYKAFYFHTCLTSLLNGPILSKLIIKKSVRTCVFVSKQSKIFALMVLKFGSWIILYRKIGDGSVCCYDIISLHIFLRIIHSIRNNTACGNYIIDNLTQLMLTAVKKLSTVHLHSAVLPEIIGQLDSSVSSVIASNADVKVGPQKIYTKYLINYTLIYHKLIETFHKYQPNISITIQIKEYIQTVLRSIKELIHQIFFLKYNIEIFKALTIFNQLFKQQK
ncbi:hypothetical protein AGLY_010193 [Aphis glycines]|uniref:Uncharacterized protein n=1 Tax=Aphis glycines TaxID=307491 RepID=A0A6G0TFX1_APHGL|nr:hypothetical protein AGLY_010193 [Aphis glycines]